jgi:DNA-directed RNA polymerase specialized sigma24 family protein
VATTTDPVKLQQQFAEAYADPRTIGMLHTFSRNCVVQLPDMDREDIVQELLIVMWNTVRGYDPDRGASFRTLLMGNCKNHVIGLVRRANVQKRGKGLIVHLSDEDFTTAATNYRAEGSAEDWYFALADHGDALHQEIMRGVA